MPARVMQRAPGEHPVPLAEVYNLRDLGGRGCAGGREVNRGMVYRADGLERARGADLETIRQMGLRTVIDLRTPDQVARGRLAVAEVGAERFHHLPLMSSGEESPIAPSGSSEEAQARGWLGLLDEGGPAVALALRVLADPSAHPVVLHGAAGQDRAGALGAVLLSVLGVDPGAGTGAVTLCLAELARRHGSVTDYCRSIGVSEEILARLVRLLTRPR